MDLETQEKERWHVVRFQFGSRRGTSPAWHLDLVVAHLVVHRLVQSHKIVMWRVHRRCDPTVDQGHEFQFSFYLPPTKGREVFAAVSDNAILKQLTDLDGTQKLTQTHDGPHGGEERYWEVKGENWDQHIKAAWPDYIHGVSKMWLGLIRSVINDDSIATVDGNVLQRYHDADESISRMWLEHGCHSMLHHLNAIFHYEPLFIGHENMVYAQF